MKRIAVFFIAVSIMLLQSCNVGTSFRETVTDNGLVVRVTGGTEIFFGIVSQNTGARYEPTNLAPEFQRDSLQIRFSGEASSNTNASNIRFGPRGWGVVITLTDVRVRTDASP